MPSTRFRLAHVALSLNVGGLERLICELARCSIADGDEVFVICIDEPGTLAAELAALGVHILSVPRKTGSDPGLVFRLAGVFRENRISVVHTHSLDPMFYGGLAAWLAGVPARVHTQHNTRLAEWCWRDRLKFSLAARLFQRVVGVSEETTRILRSFGTRPPRLATIMNGVDSRRYAPAPRTNAEAPTICTVARLSPEKGVRYLIEACASMKSAGVSFNCLIVGDGPERSHLESLTRSLALSEQVLFIGQRQDIPALLNGATLFVLPSLTEGTPVAILEAMAAGLPIAATAVGGVPEIVDAHSGILVPPGDPVALASAIVILLKDADARARFGAAARRRVESQFGLDVMANAYRSSYSAVMKTADTLAPTGKEPADPHISARALTTWQAGSLSQPERGRRSD